MPRPRFERIELSYGCHRGVYDLDVDGPVVIVGPNGSGKSTLIEAIVRTLFGFNRRQGQEADRLESRRPWARPNEWSARVTLSRGDGGRYVVEREFESDQVLVRDPDTGEVPFAGSGNPAARNQEARQFRGLLRELVGLRDLGAYESTVCVPQGALDQTELGPHLLRVAAGGHANVDAARERIHEEYRAITQRALVEGGRAAIKSRELEEVAREIRETKARLEEARAAQQRRGPLILERDEVAEKLGEVERRIAMLEKAHGEVARGGAVEVERRQLRTWIDRLEDARRDAEHAAAATRSAEEDWRREEEVGLYPQDFAERAARLETRWRDLEALEGHPPRVLALPAPALLVGAAVLLWRGWPAWAAAAAVLGALLFGVYLWLRHDARRRRSGVEAEIRTALEDVPRADSLTAETMADRVQRYREQAALRQLRVTARDSLGRVLRDARGTLSEARSALGLRDREYAEDGDGDERAEEAGPGDGATTEEAIRNVAAAMERAVRTLRERLAHQQVELERVGDASLDLPDGVVPSPEGIADALNDLRQERARVQERWQTLEQSLLEQGAPAESVTALERRLEQLDRDHRALSQRAQALRSAYALLTDSYDEFRARDQERLVRHISRRLHDLTGGALGPVEAPYELEDAVVRVDGRAVDFASPPLSFGELHAALLAVRLGAADFLAGVGVAPPLIVDEPFAHLDEERAEAVWHLLEGISEDRQVILATQETRLLHMLGVQPTIELERRIRSATAEQLALEVS